MRDADEVSGAFFEALDNGLIPQHSQKTRHTKTKNRGAKRSRKCTLYAKPLKYPGAFFEALGNGVILVPRTFQLVTKTFFGELRRGPWPDEGKEGVVFFFQPY